MKPKVYLLVFDGLADWEPAHALCEIRRSGKFEVVTAGFSRQPITTMAGLKLVPDTTIEEVKADDSALLVLPGGDMWQEHSHDNVKSLARSFHDARVPVAAICAATLEMARAGLTQNVRHTSNSLSYLKSMVPDYRDEGLYVGELAVADKGIITASGLGNVEFAREIFRLLGVFSDSDLRIWFDMFKNGMIPAGMA